MNILKFTLPILVFSGILVGCKEDFDPASQLRPSLTGVFLKASQTNFNHTSPAAFTDNFSVECSNTSWQFSSLPDWLMIKPASGDTSSAIVMNGNENTSTEARTSLFYLESTGIQDNLKKPLSVSQNGVESSLTVEPTELSLKGKGDTVTLLVIANCSWSAKCQQDWITVNTIDSNELSVTADSNPSDTYREGTVYITYGENKTVPVSITQYPANISSSVTTLKYSNVASKYNVDITSEIDWQAVVSDSWIMVNPPSGDQGKTNISIEVTPNTSVNNRIGYVAFKTGEYERFQIQIEQEGVYIQSVNEIFFRSIENSQILAVKSNTDWEILSYPSWVSFSKTKGFGNEDITVTASENPELENRSGTIKIGQKGLTLECEVSVVQSGRTLSSGTALLEFSDKGGEQTFEIISDGPWTSICSDEWFNTSPVFGNGDTAITVTAEENTARDERTGVITYSFGNQSTEVLIHQSGKYFNVDGEAFEFDSRGGNHTISLSTNEKWTVEITGNPDWISLSATSGEGAANLILTVDDNPSVNGRTADVIISPENSQAISINVSQAPRYLKISSESIMFFSEGGSSEYISIDTDGTYEITSDGSWFRVNQDDGAGFTVIADSYRQPETRTGKISVSLTDLDEGALSLEISVIQIGEGCSFIVDSYTDDQDWNDFGNSVFSFSIVGYTADKSWDSTQHPYVKILIEGYTGDDDWNTTENSDMDISIDKFDSNTESWNSNEKEDVDFNIDRYDEEENWNTKQEEDIELEVTDYSPDINWNE
ncbi:MAG: BACON domain-containing protein [Bacteroides sp.]|nr:BACON domain-containing protein [Bacteroides sp.]